MGDFYFGNLRDWWQVMEKLDHLKAKKKLGQHQEDLIGILRYKDNWRLRETVLDYIKDIENPSDDLIDQVLQILLDDSVYYELRVLAASALGVLATRIKKTSEKQQRITIGEIAEKAKGLLQQPQAPILHDAVRSTLSQIDHQ